MSNLQRLPNLRLITTLTRFISIAIPVYFLRFKTLGFTPIHLLGHTIKIPEITSFDPNGGNNGRNGDHRTKNNKNSSSKQKSNYHVGTSKKSKKKRQNSRQVSQKAVDRSYNNFHKEMQEQGLDATKVTKERYEEMCRNRTTQQFESQKLEEANGLFEGEVRGYYRDVEPVYDLNNPLDAQAILPDGRSVFVDHKIMPDFNKMGREKGINTSHFPKSDAVAFNIGKDSVIQKSKHIQIDKKTGKFFNHPNFPTDKSEVIHLINFNNIE